MEKTIKVFSIKKSLDWKKLLKYFTWLSVICFSLSIVTIISNDFLLKLIYKLPLPLWSGIAWGDLYRNVYTIVLFEKYKKLELLPS